MAETVKKTTRKPKAAAAKPRKSAAKTNGAATNVTVMHPSYEQVAQLAHRFWIERGHQHGSDIDDWFRAEQELRSKAS